VERPEGNASKREWRRWAKRLRRGLDLERISARLTARLAGWPGYREAEHVLVYLAFGTEIDLRGLDLLGKDAYATRAHEGGRLSIHPLTTVLERHRLGFFQPPAGAVEVDPRTIDLALVPGLVFDERGHRLGYGLGYYDRLLPFLREDALLVGVSADTLIVPVLPSNAHDVPMTHLVSESGVRPVRR
jgi:5-formyltetrahydrofolate cyclo-ligase